MLKKLLKYPCGFAKNIDKKTKLKQIKNLNI